MYFPVFISSPKIVKSSPIGKTSFSLQIKRDFKSTLKNGYHYNKELQNDWDTFGEKSFIVELLEECKKDDFKLREQFWMDYYLCYDYGYNKQRYSGHSPKKFK